MRKYLLLLFVAIYSVPAMAQEYLLSGRITGQDNKPLSFATIYIRHSTYGTVANEQGFYKLRLNQGTYTVAYRLAGYKEQAEHITIDATDIQHNVQLINDIYTLKQLTTVKGHVIDSAVGMIKQVMAKRQYYLQQVKAYSCVEYIKGVQKLVKAPKGLMGPNVINALSVDSSGKGILFQTE